MLVNALTNECYTVYGYLINVVGLCTAAAPDPARFATFAELHLGTFYSDVCVCLNVK